MTFAQRRNRLMTHFSEPIPVFKRRISLQFCTTFNSDLQRHTAIPLPHSVGHFAPAYGSHAIRLSRQAPYSRYSQARRHVYSNLCSTPTHAQPAHQHIHNQHTNTCTTSTPRHAQPAHQHMRNRKNMLYHILLIPTRFSRLPSQEY